jgi:5'-3' exonuclease
MRLHVVDGTYELYRAHFSKRPDVTAPDGRNVKATVGLVYSMLSLIDLEQVTHIAVAFDNPIASFRNDLFHGYKSDEGVPPELRAQFDLAEEAVRAAGIVVWSMKQWEADDALATAAFRWRGELDQVRIMTPDKDLGQCVQDTRVVQVDRMRNRVIDEDAVRAARGVGPESIPDLLALTGDDADGIPGIAGFGAKSAAALLAKFVTIERIPEDWRAWGVSVRGAERLAAELRERREEALLYKKLATLVKDVPLEESLDDLRWRGAPREAFLAMCERLGTQALREQPRAWQ